MDVLTLQQAKADAAARYFALNKKALLGFGTQVASDCYGTSYDGATKQAALQTASGTSSAPYMIATDCGDIRLVYCNWYTDRLATSAPATGPATFADVDGPADITVSASIDTTGSGAATYRVTFGGKTSATINPGGMVISDPLGITLAAGVLIKVRTFISSTGWYPNRRSLDSSGSGGWTATTDVTAPGTAGALGTTIADSTGSLFCPAAILGVARSAFPSVALYGDSIGNGFGDSVTSTNDFAPYNSTQPWRTGGGYIGRALRGHAGVINCAVGGDFARKFSGLESPQTSSFRRHVWTRFCTHAIDEYVRNDLSNPSTLANIQTYKIAIWSNLARRGVKVWTITALPRTTSTDGFFTTVNQTVHTSEAVRLAYNAWIRDGAPVTSAASLTAVAVGTVGALRAGGTGHPLTGYFETADAAESARDSGFWKVPYLIVTDAAMTSASNVLTSATAAFSSARDVGTTVTVRGAGAAAADLTASIQSVTNSTTAVLTTSAGTTVSGATAGLGVMCLADGIHPSVGGHKRLADSGCIDYTKLT